jgi:hypothetical protein
VTYAYLAKGRNEQEMMQLDMALAPTPQKAQETQDAANMRAMKQLEAMMPTKPPRPKGV